MLPDVLLLPDGSRATNAEEWQSRHRPALLALFTQHVYGRAAPGLPPTVLARRGPWAIHGGTVEELSLTLWPDMPPLTVLLARPLGNAPAPCFVGLNFTGNHSLVDHRVPISIAKGNGAYGQPRTIARDQYCQTWCIEALVARGWAVATAYYGELECDNSTPDVSLSRTWREAGIADGGAISSWAWQLQRIIDIVVQDPHIDTTNIVTVGHSRLGKTALWTAAQDPRVAAVIANQSGCGGAAPARQCSPGAETIRDITTYFAYWFHPAFCAGINDPTALPVDQHQLLALCAPRVVLLSNAEGDRWADPAGQLTALQAAAPAWHLSNPTSAAPHTMPDVGSGGGQRLRWWWRLGPHAHTPAEWAAWLPILAEEL